MELRTPHLGSRQRDEQDSRSSAKPKEKMNDSLLQLLDLTEEEIEALDWGEELPGAGSGVLWGICAGDMRGGRM